MVIKEVMKMVKQRAIKLNLNRTFEEKNYPCDRNHMKVDKGDLVDFEPACVFTEKKGKLLRVIPRFWKGTRNLVLFVDGAKNALRFSKTTKEMMPFWTKKESGEFVNKQVARSLTQYKPMKWAQFIIILIPTVASLFVLLKIAFHFGVF